MALPPLYKYLDVNGAKKTLSNKTFRHAKPSTFEDLEEMTIRSIFPESVDTALAKLSCGCVDVILDNIDRTPATGKFSEVVTALQKVLKVKPELADAMREETNKDLINLDEARTLSERMLTDLNEFMQGYRILCVTTDNASERMWEDYAQDHEGIALRIEPKKNSKLELFRPVTYHASRPALYDETLDMLKGHFFENQDARTRAMMDKVIYCKTLPYKFEKEYRLAIPSDDEGDWTALPYSPEEITELYLGLAMKDADKKEIVAMARAANANIKVFRGNRNAKKKLIFEQI